MFRRSRTKRTRGQALVEFALAATLIFTLLSAAVDLGLIFFSLQALRTAAQEGAAFGSHPRIYESGGVVTEVNLDYDEIVRRVRRSAGATSTGFVDLFDLNSDDILDDSQGGITDDPADPDSYIYIENLSYPFDALYDTSGNPLAPAGACLTTTPRQGLRNAGRGCYVRVTVSYEYHFIFPLAPVFGDTIKLQATQMMRVRSSFIG